MKKTILKTMYNLGAFAPFRLANREKILILTYHRFSLEKSAYKISSAEFAAQLEYLKKNNRVLPLAEVVDCLENGKSLPPNTTVITIDDGYSDAYEVAFPVLKKFDMPATLYAVTDFLDGKCWLWTDLMRYVLSETKSENLNVAFSTDDKIDVKFSSDTQKLETASRLNLRLKKMPNEQKEAKIKEIAESLKVEIPALPTGKFSPVTLQQAREMDAENVKIESHTATHPILTNISEKHLDFELKTSKIRLEEILDRRVEHFCYPNGSFDENVRKAVEKAGYKSAVTTAYGFNEKQANCFLLNRIDAQSGIADFAQSASGFEALKQKIRI